MHFTVAFPLFIAIILHNVSDGNLSNLKRRQIFGFQHPKIENLKFRSHNTIKLKISNVFVGLSRNFKILFRK